ncbi:MAG: hypothetical protein GY862_14060, partial [Gammaproteobacteria bacterium]|nr:hypothetical protein [Gammaproteobacteria bacterium]
MNVNQASTGLDKILTKSSQGYGHAPENMWPHLFPYVAIPDRLNNKVLVFDDSMFVMADPNAHQRAPGTHIKGITFTYSDTPISYKQYALAAVIPQEILEAANEGPKLNLKLHHIHLLQDYFDLRKEVQ